MATMYKDPSVAYGKIDYIQLLRISKQLSNTIYMESLFVSSIDISVRDPQLHPYKALHACVKEPCNISENSC